MAHYALVNQRTGAIIASHLELADSAWARLRGLLGRSDLAAGHGMRIRPSGSVHMMFMRFPIDVVFANRDDEVVKTVRGLKPWRFSGAMGAHTVFELSTGTLDRYDIVRGDPLAVQHVSDVASTPNEPSA
jgi:uncharacterized membrane protein (UPF0127 family)